MMALLGLRLLLLLLVGEFADTSDAQAGEPSEYRTPDCDRYRLPGCPRDFNPVCGSDMTTYPNECTLCVKIRESGHDMKIIRSEAC